MASSPKLAFALLFLAAALGLAAAGCKSHQTSYAPVPYPHKSYKPYKTHHDGYGQDSYLSKMKTSYEDYKPETIDWAGVVSACKALGKYEKRLLSFCLRTTFHDGMAVDPNNVYGGMDGSIFTHDEMERGENKGFTVGSLRAVMTIAHMYGASYADTLAICGAVAVEVFSGYRVKIIGKHDYSYNFMVGRMDSMRPAAKDQLVKPDGDVDDFGRFWESHGFTVDEGCALLGSHAMIEELGCSRSNVPDDDCDPSKGSCASDVRMFKWSNHYYKDTCTPSIELVDPEPKAKPATADDLEEELKSTKCRYTSKEYRNKRSNKLKEEMREGKLEGSVEKVKYESDSCQKGQEWGAGETCPHTDEWRYTINDVHLGRACQGLDTHKEYAAKVKEAMREYLDLDKWDESFTAAYLKMVSRYVTLKRDSEGKAYYINGRECPSGYKMSDTCAHDAGMRDYSHDMCSKCYMYGKGDGCHSCCYCTTAYDENKPLKMEPEIIKFEAPHA